MKGMSPKEIHDDFIKTLGDESPSYRVVKKWAVEFRRGRKLDQYLRDVQSLSYKCRCVPRMLTKNKKKRRLYISKYLLSLYDDPEEFMWQVVPQDET